MKPPVLILGAVPRIAIPIARSLHDYGIPVDVATFSPVEKSLCSHAIRNFYRLPDPDAAPSVFADSVCQLIRMHGHDTLIPCNDVALTAIVEHYERFRDLLHVCCPPPDTLRYILNKNLTLQVAEKCGIRVPRSVLVSSSAKVPEFASAFGYPVILKPNEKRRSEDFKACLIRSADHLETVFPQPRIFSSPMLLQEFCHGDGVGVEVLRHNRTLIAAFQHRRRKELPHTGGVAVLATSESTDPGLVHSTSCLLDALHWDGLAMVEFKVNPRDGASVLMEVNGRYWGSISLPILAGFNFPLFHWKVLHDEPPEVPPVYRTGLQWRWSAGYLRRFHDLMLGALRAGSSRDVLLHDLHYLRADFADSRDPLWTRSDPMPAMLEVIGMFQNLIRSDFSTGYRRLSRRPAAVLKRAKHFKTSIGNS
jgi:predicted ATP-grasp superfamily ATP-dependent carboligase